MSDETVWERVGALEKPVDGYATLTFRMRVSGGNLYHVVLMDTGGWGRTRLHTSLAFVPDAIDRQKAGTL
jgi:hypothetical protein